jgi:hypothetical protein
MSTQPTGAELDVLARKGSWVVGLAATNSALTDLLVSHVVAEGELHAWELLEDFADWYMNAALLSVNLTFVNAYLEDVVERNVDEADVMSVIDQSFLVPIRLALDDSARREAGRAAVAALGPLMQERARETQGIIHAHPK